MRSSDRRVGRLLAAAATGCLAAAMWAPVGASAAPSTHIDGRYRIVSTDCYFSGGTCKATFDIEQSGTRLSDTGDSLLHGRVSGEHVRVGERYPQGTSEDSWTASGSTEDGGRTIAGTFYDGLGSTGHFTMTYVGR